jgi:hypothetical protein
MRGTKNPFSEPGEGKRQEADGDRISTTKKTKRCDAEHGIKTKKSPKNKSSRLSGLSDKCVLYMSDFIRFIKKLAATLKYKTPVTKSIKLRNA